MHRSLFLTAFLLGLIFPVAVSWSDSHWKTLLPDGEGKQVTAELCGTCHNLQKTVVSRKTAQEWERTVYDMIRRGAQIFPEEADQIVKYLAANFPPGKPVQQ
jgi:mono/diheme cytochrome c family protein